MKQYSYFLIYLQAISPVRNWRVMVLIIKIGMMKKNFLKWFMENCLRRKKKAIIKHEELFHKNWCQMYGR
jgi:hypothetical protein